jgi:predicted metalloprotease
MTRGPHGEAAHDNEGAVMRWEDQRRSDNVDDQRQAGGGLGGGFGRGGLGGGFGGRGFPIPLGRGGGKIGGIGMVLVVLALMYFGGGDLGGILGQLTGEPPQSPPQTQAERNPAPGQAVPGRAAPARRGDAADFVRVVLASTEDSWKDIFSQMGRQYEEPKLVLFRDAVQSECGGASAASGPFYCPLDRRIYVDLSFFDDLAARFGAPGDFAQAYVIAHEVGHHVQTLLGISQKVQAARRNATDQASGNDLSVRLELQADCFAGVWAAHSEKQRNWLDQGDVKEALDAATAIGDDRLQKRTQGRVVPESFTHGSSAQRVRWFQRGMAGGDLRQCDTFSAQTL